MLKETIKLRVSVEELALWKQSAEKSDLGLSEWIRARCNGGERRQQAGAAAQSGLPERVTPPKPSGFVQGEVAEPAEIDFLPMPSPGICANCEHKKSKHGGFGDCCQQDNCQCPRFE